MAVHSPRCSHVLHVLALLMYQLGASLSNSGLQLAFTEQTYCPCGRIYSVIHRAGVMLGHPRESETNCCAVSGEGSLTKGVLKFAVKE
ncbi:hypothetical protein BKA56DRAFT_590914 [Ilyonectria sp. MPI-CAGE-AT-0026]|nr:hypothetical protein BKA56DRAFT_590914 [Ilyonectria sp. MPI-CAGE-AT-0026]